MNFLKNVLPRLLGRPAQEALASLDISLTDKEGNLRDIIQVYTEVANATKNISDSERISVTEGLAGKFHINRMQLFLDSLGDVDSMYRNMEESSKNSGGSALQENEEYMKSFNARLGLARVEVEKLALGIGEAFLSESMLQGIQMFGNVLEAISSVVKVVGALPLGLGAAGLALALLSTKFKGLTVAISQSMLGLLGFKTATSTSGAVAATLGARLVGLGASMKAFVLSTGLAGVAFVALGFALEKVMGAMGKQREAQEAIERNNRELARSYRENGEEIKELASRYETLQSIMRTGTEKEKTEVADEYLAVQNKLAELMPNLSTGEDEYGNAVLGNATILENRIKLIEKQIEAEEKLQDVKNADKEKKEIKAQEDNLNLGGIGKDYQIEKFNNRNNAVNGHLIDKYNEEIKSYEDMTVAIKHYEEESAKYAASGDTTRENYANKRIAKLQKIASEYIKFSDNYNAAEVALASSSFESTEKIINDNDKLSDSTKEMATTITSTIATLGIETGALKDVFSGITDGLDDNGQLGTFIDNYTTAFSRLEKAQKDGLKPEELDNYLKTAQNSFELVRDEVLQTAIANGVLENSVEYADLEARLISYGNANLVSAEFVSKLALATGQSTEQIRAQILATSDGTMMMEDFEDATEGVVAKQYELKDAIDQMSGVAQQQIDDTETMTWQYDMLTAQLETLAVGTDAYNEVNGRLIGVKEQLLALYPHLFSADQTAEKLTYKQIEAIRQEVEANDILRAAYKASRDGKLTADEDKAISGIETAKTEIHNINEQIKALNRLAAAYRAFSEKSMALAQDLKNAGGLDSEAEDAFIQAQKWKGFADKTDANNAGALATYKAELAGVTKTQKGFIDTLKDSEAVMGNTTTSANKLASEKKKGAKETKGSDKVQKDYNETLKESIYLANTYKEAMEKLNLEMSRLNEIKSKYPTHSKEYKKALEQELAVLYQKKELIQDEAKYINSQISSGNVAKTGIVTKSSGGTYTGKYAKEVNAAAAKHGIDAQLIAAVIQAESNFNPNSTNKRSGAQGLMQLMPATARGLGVKDSYNPEQNIMGGAKYLAQQLKTFGGDIKVALAAYNAGPGNVKKYGGIPPFKETQNYVKKITDALGKTAVSTASAAGKSVADYYTGNGFSVSSGFGKRNAPIKGASTDHKGLDLAAKAGTEIKSLRAGKVIASYYHDKSGNAISIQQDDGTVAKYFHMQSKSKLVAGQAVKAGDQIGKVGNTGNSKGNHLHLQIEKGGKAVDPLPYLKEQNKSIEDASQAIAENLQDLDALRSDLNSKSQDIFSINEQIRALQRSLIDVEMDKYAKKQKVFLGFLDEEVAKKDSLDLSSTRYQNSLKRSIKYIGKQVDEYKKELALTENLIKNGKLDAVVKEEMQEKAEALRLTLVGLNNEMKDFSVERIDASQRVFSENISDIDYEIEKSKAIMSLYKEGTIEYNKEFTYQIENMKKKQQEGKTQRDSLQKSLLLHDLKPEKIKEYKEQIQQLTLEYWNLESAINASEKEFATKLAESLIDSYKAVIEQKKDMQQKLYDEEAKVEDKRHKTAMKNLSTELDKYKAIIQAKLDSIDDEESEADYNKEMDKLGVDKSKIQGDINLLSMDDSYEAKSQRKKLQEELATLEETIVDKRHKREVDLRKENLQNMLTEKEKSIAKEEEAEDLAHENAKDRIDKLKTYWDQFYTDQLNDERKFAKLRKDVMKGNLDEISIEFKEYLKGMEETMPSLENTMDGTMQAVGTSIRQNIIDTLKEAIDLMGQVRPSAEAPLYQGSAGAPPSGGSSSSGSSGGSSGGTSSGSGKTLSQADLSVLGGKFLADKLRSQETNNSRRETISDRAKSMAADGRSQGSTLAANKGFDELVTGLSASEKTSLASYLGGRVQSMFSTPNLQSFIADYVKKLEASGAAFETGGYTGKKSGIALLHDEEFVLNKGQTKEAFKMADLFANLNRFASMITTPKQPTLAGATTGGDTYEINFNVDKMTGNESDVKRFTKSFTDDLKRNKGVR